MCPPPSNSFSALFSGCEEKSSIALLPDDETSSFSVVHLDLTGEGPERGRIIQGVLLF